jgi:hypothetical protein
VLDGADAEARGARDGCGVGMGADAAAEGGCLFHHRADFAIPATVDHAGVRKRDRLGRGLLDPVAFDDQLVAAKQLPGVGSKHLEILEMVDFHGRIPGRRTWIETSYADLRASMSKRHLNGPD